MPFDLTTKEDRIRTCYMQACLAYVNLRYSALGYAVDSIASSLENIVYLELKRRGYDVYIGKIKDKEIDFEGRCFIVDFFFLSQYCENAV